MATDSGSAVKMVVSYGGEIVRCPGTGKPRYAGGENRIVRVGMSERLADLRARLAALAGYPDVRIRYALPSPVGDGLDTNLHDVADDRDLWVLVTRLCCCDGRVRAFLYPVDAPPPPPPVPDDRIRRRASSPLLLLDTTTSHQEEDSASITATTTSGDVTCSARPPPPLARAQSAGALYAPAATSPVTSSSGGSDASAAQVDPGFEALAEIAAAQRSATGYAAASSSLVASAAAAAPPTGRAIAQSSAAGYTTACGGATATGCAALAADSGFEALAAVAAEQSGRGPSPPAAAPVFLVAPVLLAAVFFRAIPVYGCFVPAAGCSATWTNL